MGVGLLKCSMPSTQTQPPLQPLAAHVRGGAPDRLHQQVEVPDLVPAQSGLLHDFDAEVAAYSVLPDLLQEPPRRRRRGRALLLGPPALGGTPPGSSPQRVQRLGPLARLLHGLRHVHAAVPLRGPRRRLHRATHAASRTSIARPHSGTRWSRFIFIRVAGIAHT